MINGYLLLCWTVNSVYLILTKRNAFSSYSPFYFSLRHTIKNLITAVFECWRNTLISYSKVYLFLGVNTFLKLKIAIISIFNHLNNLHVDRVALSDESAEHSLSRLERLSILQLPVLGFQPATLLFTLTSIVFGHSKQLHRSYKLNWPCTQ